MKGLTANDTFTGVIMGPGNLIFNTRRDLASVTTDAFTIQGYNTFAGTIAASILNTIVSTPRTSDHRGVRISRIVTVVPAGASVVRRATAFRRATSTAPLGGIGCPPFCRTCVARARSVTFGTVAGKEGSTTSTVPLSGGVVGPQADV